MISLIAAVAHQRIIGKDNQLPWHLPDDMKYFMNKTKHHTVVMGRKNFESLPPKFRPLPERTNVIITRQSDFQAEGCLVYHSWEAARRLDRPELELFVIGGSEIYQLALPDAQRLYLTEVEATYPGDRFFPDYNTRQWREISRHPHPPDNRHAVPFSFVVYERIE